MAETIVIDRKNAPWTQKDQVDTSRTDKKDGEKKGPDTPAPDSSKQEKARKLSDNSATASSLGASKGEWFSKSDTEPGKITDNKDGSYTFGPSGSLKDLTPAKRFVMEQNAKNAKAQQEWLRNSTNPDHKYLTSDTIDTKNLANLVGDNAATRKFDDMKGTANAAQDRMLASQKSKGGAYASRAEREGSFKNLAGDKAPIFTSNQGDTIYINELGKGSVSANGDFKVNGMRLGTLQYDTARAKETGHTGASFVHIDQPIVQGGKTVLEAGSRLRIGTGDIFDADGKRIGKFTQNADFTEGGFSINLDKDQK